MELSRDNKLGRAGNRKASRMLPLALETFGMHSLDYKEEYLREDVPYISLYFQYNSNDVGIGIEAVLSESDKVMMALEADYDYEEKKLIYDPIYIIQGEPCDSAIYSDEKSIDDYLNRYVLTRQDVKKYQEYAIYDVIVKTWSKAYKELYWLERWKLKVCRVVSMIFCLLLFFRANHCIFRANDIYYNHQYERRWLYGWLYHKYQYSYGF